MSKTLTKAMNKATEVSRKVDKFSDLLDSIEALEDKRKHLWKEIYENAFRILLMAIQVSFAKFEVSHHSAIK